MSEFKPFASLSSGLLARKGAARPAMRPQGPSGEDLGWNDHGAPAPRRGHAARALTPMTEPMVRPRPSPAREQRTAIAERMGLQTEEGAAAAKPRRAFTLRLDPHRHLRLRLVCAVTGRSAQQLMTEALDRMLGEHPQIDQLAGKARDEK